MGFRGILSGRAIQQTPAVVFDVAAVTPAATALPEVAYKDAVESLLRKPPSRMPDRIPRQPKAPEAVPFRPVEACSSHHGRLVFKEQGR
jgi:hypothetical protein